MEFNFLRYSNHVNGNGAELDIADMSEITGFSKTKVMSIEKGVENRLLHLQLESLIKYAQH